MLGRFVQNLLKPVIAVLAFSSLILPMAVPAYALGNAAKALYVGNEYYAPTQAWQDTARTSGFTTLCLFTMHVQANGNLDYNGTALVTNGVYVGDSTWGSKLAACKASPSTVNRIELTIGGYGDPSFTNIKDLIASQGTSSGSILYRSFQALKNATGIDAIQYDDEGTYDSDSAVSFGNMISSLGMKVTLCPYTNQSFWVNVKSGLGSKVDAIYLQCYDGGAGNDPGDWNNAFGGFKVYPGLWGNVDSMASATAKFRNWQSNLGITGGFLWLNGSFPWDGQRWGEALHLGVDPIPFFNIVNQNSSKSLDLISGNTANDANVNQWTSDYNSANQRWALAPTENHDHFKLISWVSGKAMSIAGDSTNTGAQLTDTDYTYGDPSQQWDLVDMGSGWYNIRNVRSGLYLDVSFGNTNDNGTVWQWSSNNGGANQKWRLQPWGNYFVRADSGKYICVQSEGRSNSNPLLHSTTIRSTVVQYTQENNPWFQWQFVSEGDGFYGLFNLNATNRVLCVQNGSTAPGYNTHLWDYNPNNVGDQKIRITPLTNGKFKFYFGHDGMSWNIPGGSTANNTKLQQYPDNSYPWQQFSLERAQ